MAITEIEANTLKSDETFRIKVWGQIVRAAYQINGETPAVPADNRKDTLRKQTAIAIIQNPESKLDTFCTGVALFPTFNPATIDADLAFIISSIFDDIAGV